MSKINEKPCLPETQILMEERIFEQKFFSILLNEMAGTVKENKLAKEMESECGLKMGLFSRR